MLVRAAGLFVHRLCAERGRDAEFFLQLTRGGDARILTRLHFPTGRDPEDERAVGASGDEADEKDAVVLVEKEDASGAAKASLI